jgi:hypothetical protein
MTMRRPYIYLLSIAIVIVGLTMNAFLYTTAPRTLAEVATKGQVAIGTYQIDKQEFANGLASFRREDYPGARVAMDRADPEKRDATVQFYVAYSYYRQGWGRISNDDALFQSGLVAVNRTIAIDPSFRTNDEGLQMKTAAELKTELEEGLKVTPSDFNPLRIVRERK